MQTPEASVLACSLCRPQQMPCPAWAQGHSERDVTGACVAQLTVLESLVFSARLRHPATTPARTVYAFVGEVRCRPLWNPGIILTQT